MKRLLLVCVCLSFVACASLRTSSGSIDWHAILIDAQFGVSAACSQSWLNATDCAIASDAISTTDAVIAKAAPAVIKGAVHKTLGDVVAKLPADSKVTPFLQYMVDLSA